MTPSPQAQPLTAEDQITESEWADLRAFVNGKTRTMPKWATDDPRRHFRRMMAYFDALAVTKATIDAQAAKPPTVQLDTWRCFHCDEVFTDRDAAFQHFGGGEFDACACQLTKDEKGLIGLLRESWEELYKFRSEQDADTKLFYSLGADHHTALIKAEQAGYDKGLADGRALISDLPGLTTPTTTDQEPKG